jgi:hypothetical protein
VQTYPGSVANPYPPTPPGWMVCGHADETARARCACMCAELEQCGQALPMWCYADELHPTGLYRFFTMEDPTGAQGIAAMRYVGPHAATLGVEEDPGGTGTATDPLLTDSGTSLLPSSGDVNIDAPTLNPGGTPTVAPTKPTPTPTPVNVPPAPAPAPAATTSSSSSTGLVIGVVAALAVVGTIIAAAAAKHPVH